MTSPSKATAAATTAGSPTTASDDVPLLGAKGTKCKFYKKKLIGNGSYGEAYICERATDGAVLVAKIMDLGAMSARDKQYAYSEIKCLAACEHPNIIQYHEDAEDDATLTIIMEFADAGDLDRQVKSRAHDKRFFQEHEVVFLFLQEALALQHVHAKKMLHRDIKGANVLLNSNGLIKLADFGFSHQYNDTVSGKVASTFLGTPYYLAPEIWKNERYSKKADVWSLGVLLYEMCALDRPFTANSMKGLMNKVCSGTVPDIPSRYSSDLNQLVKKILVVDANRRPSINDLFKLPFVQKGMNSFKDTINRNSKIPDESKKAFEAQIAEIEQLVNANASSSSGNSGSGAAPAVGEINKSVAHDGVVFKQSPSANGTIWKEKYLVLARGYLILCDRKGDEKNGKALNLQTLQSVCPVPKSNAHRAGVFSLNTNAGKSMWLQSPSVKEMEGWMGAIHTALGI